MKTIAIDRLPDLAQALSKAGYRVVAPVDEGGVVRLREWTKGLALALDAVPVNSVNPGHRDHTKRSRRLANCQEHPK